jgi:hypothetical protein
MSAFLKSVTNGLDIHDLEEQCDNERYTDQLLSGASFLADEECQDEDPYEQDQK